MNRIIRMTVATLAIMGLSAGLMADDMGKEMTQKGELVDLACYLGHGAKGDKHKQCALDCIKGGSPMGLLTKEGKVYLLVENHGKKDAYASLKGMAGEQVSVSGDLRTSDGIQAIEVEKASKG